MPGIPVTSPFTPQEYQVGYLTIDDNLMTEVESIKVMVSDGGADVTTLVRDYAGRLKGAAITHITISGVVPYMPTDTGGSAFDSGGMVTGNQIQLDQTILTGLNQNSNQPVKFILSIGQPAAQKLVFKGFIYEITTDVAVGKQISFTALASGAFSTFQ